MAKPAIISLADVLDDLEPFQPVAEPDGPVTWEQLATLEPRLADLRARVWRVRDRGEESFCANRVWFNEFKPELRYLVGWMRREGPDVLRTSRAFEIAYQTIYDELPDCRNCGCM